MPDEPAWGLPSGLLVASSYNDGAFAVNTNQPTDVSIAPASGGLVLSPSSRVVVVAFAILQIGPGTTSVNAALGVHHPDGSGGSTFSNLVEDSPARASMPITRMAAYSPGQWSDATFRMAITQVGATGNGTVFGSFIGVWIVTP